MKLSAAVLIPKCRRDCLCSIVKTLRERWLSGCCAMYGPLLKNTHILPGQRFNNPDHRLKIGNQFLRTCLGLFINPL